MELHDEVGPARTTVSDVARRAGVSRLTVYNNFPDERALIGACQAHWLALNPMPDLSATFALEDPSQRLRGVLVALYGWYRETEGMTTNVYRDRGAVPALNEVMSERVDPMIDALGQQLAAGFAKRGRPRKPVLAATALALDFWAWRRLAHQGMSDRAAAELMSGLVGSAAAGR